MKIDNFIYHQLNRIQGSLLSPGEYTDNGLVTIPFLLRVRNSSWQPFDIPDLKIISRLGRIFACTGTKHTFESLIEDPGVVDSRIKIAIFS